jgi:hypothetical protein
MIIFFCFLLRINKRGQLTSSLEEYLDHIHYIQDIFLLNVDSLNNVLKEQLMNRLLIPVFIFSLIKRDKFSRVKVKILFLVSYKCKKNNLVFSGRLLYSDRGNFVESIKSTVKSPGLKEFN